MKMTDGRKTIEIQIKKWDGTQYGACFAADFFEVPYNSELDAYVVDDVDYCINYAINNARLVTNDNGDDVIDENIEVFVNDLEK